MQQYLMLILSTPFSETGLSDSSSAGWFVVMATSAVKDALPHYHLTLSAIMTGLDKAVHKENAALWSYTFEFPTFESHLTNMQIKLFLEAIGEQFYFN